jgi:hypothetical protein
MTQYDAGPGDLSDRPWEDPDRKPQPHARRRKVALPPWALLAVLVGIIILLCVGLVLLVQAIRGRDGQETPVPTATATLAAAPSATVALETATAEVAPTNTVVLPLGTAGAIDTPSVPVEIEPGLPGEIGPGALVIVQGTLGSGLNLRTEPSTAAELVTNAAEGTVLTVLEGPQEADGYLWWKLRTPDGEEGWAADEWLTLNEG